jgi:hypothetical protein
MGTGLAVWRCIPVQGEEVDSRRAKLQLRIIQVVMASARPEDRPAMGKRAVQILDAVALEIEGTADADLADLLSRVRAEVAPGR